MNGRLRFGSEPDHARSLVDSSAEFPLAFAPVPAIPAGTDRASAARGIDPVPHGLLYHRVKRLRRVENTRDSKAWGSVGLWSWQRRCYLVSGLLQLFDHFHQTRPLALGAYRGTAFFIAKSLVQNLPNETAQAVRNGPDRLLVFQARLQALKDHFKNASLPLDCGVCGFIEQPAQSAVAFGRTATARLPSGDSIGKPLVRPVRLEEV